VKQKEGKFKVDEETDELVLIEDDNEERFYIEQEINLDDNRYLILIPSEEGKYDQDEALVLKLFKEGESEVLSIIEDEEEFEKVKEAYINN